MQNTGCIKYKYLCILARLLPSGQHLCSAYAFLISWGCLPCVDTKKKDILHMCGHTDKKSLTCVDTQTKVLDMCGLDTQKKNP